MSFVESKLLETIGDASESALDELPFGAVKVDDEGKVILYNRWESEMAGVSPDAAKGRNFFTQVAPCTNNRLFYGRFKKGVEAGEMNLEFRYTFTYKMKPTNVQIHLHRDAKTQSNWVFVANG